MLAGFHYAEMPVGKEWLWIVYSLSATPKKIGFPKSQRLNFHNTHFKKQGSVNANDPSRLLSHKIIRRQIIKQPCKYGYQKTTTWAFMLARNKTNRKSAA